MNNYINHNQSITVTVENDEWEDVKKWLHENWDCVIGVSFLPRWDPSAGDIAAYPNLPLEPSTKEVYEKLSSEVNFSEVELLTTIALYQQGYKGEDEQLESDCATGACPVR